jgi:hypothetical protein
MNDDDVENTIVLNGLNGITSSDFSTYSGSITMPSTYITTGSNYTISNGTWNTFSNGASYNNTSIDVKGDANFEGDIKLKGKSLSEFMETIEKRLSILQPDPKKLKKYEALQKAYNHYKMLEALCEADDENQQ